MNSLNSRSNVPAGNVCVSLYKLFSAFHWIFKFITIELIFMKWIVNYIISRRAIIIIIIIVQFVHMKLFPVYHNHQFMKYTMWNNRGRTPPNRVTETYKFYSKQKRPKFPRMSFSIVLVSVWSIFHVVICFKFKVSRDFVYLFMLNGNYIALFTWHFYSFIQVKFIVETV